MNRQAGVSRAGGRDGGPLSPLVRSPGSVAARYVRFLVPPLLICAALGPCSPQRARCQGAGLVTEFDDYRLGLNAYEDGIAAQSKGRTQQAMDSFARADNLFRGVLQRHPERTDVYAPLGDILIRKGQHAAAYVLLNTQVRAGVKDPQVKWQLARALHGIHQSRRALEMAQQVVAAEPDNLVVLGFVGARAYELGDYGVAVKAFTRLTSGKHRADDPEQSWYRRLLGLSLAKSGQRAAGLAVIEKLSSEDPDNLSVRQALGELLCTSPVPAESARGLAILEKLGQQRPDDAQVLYQLGAALLEAGRAPAALVHLRRYTQLVPTDEHGMAQYARALCLTGKAGEAIALLQAQSGQNGETGEIQAALGRAHLLLRPPAVQTAAANLSRAAALLPGDVAVCVDHALVLQRLGRVQPALDEAQRCGRMRAHDGALLALQGQLLDALGRQGEAVAIYQAALKERRDPAWERGLAHALLMRGIAAGKAGLRDLIEAYQWAPGAITTRALGLAYLQAGRPDETVRILKGLAEGGAEPAVLLPYGRALSEVGQGGAALAVFQRAEEVLAKAGAQAPSYVLLPALHKEQAAALLGLRRPGEACSLLDDAEDDEGRHLLGIACLQAAWAALKTDGGLKAAQAALQEAQKQASRLTETERGELAVLQAVMTVRTGVGDQPVKAVQELERGHGAALLQGMLGPGGLEDLQARAALRAGQLPQGSQYATKALAKLPAAEGQLLQTYLIGVYVNRAMVAYERGDYERAQMLLRAPVGADPAQRPAIVNYDLGAVALARGKRDEALALFNRLEPKEVPEKWIALGAYYDGLGDRKLAVENYRKYLLAVPTGVLVDRVKRWIEIIQRFYPGGASGPAAAPGLGTPQAGGGGPDVPESGGARQSVAARRNPKPHSDRGGPAR